MLFSVGITFIDKKEKGNIDSIESCIKKADELLYKAKENGRNRIEI